MYRQNCVRCGQEAGAFSEGGLRWAICEDCMAADRMAADRIGPHYEKRSIDLLIEELSIEEGENHNGR